MTYHTATKAHTTAQLKWISRYGDPRSPAQIKRLPREDMVRAARYACLLECLSEEEIASATVAELRQEIDAVVSFMVVR